MDTREDRAANKIEKKFGPAECNCEGGDGYSERPYFCELAYTLNGETHHYRDIWEKIEDLHYAECPIAIAAKQKRKSTLCMCGPLEKAKAPEECLRCHNLAADCKCGAKAQLV